MKTALTIICLAITVTGMTQESGDIGLGNRTNWHITGNTNTNPSNNFLGTIDNVRLVFRTNNTEKVTILSNGYMGLGIAKPKGWFHSTDGTTGAMNFAYESGAFEKAGDNKLSVFSTTAVPDANTGAAAVTLGYTNLKNTKGFYPGYEM